MFNSRHKLAVFAALSATPDYSLLSFLQKLHRAELSKFLTWLDRSGLSLYFLSRVNEQGMQGELPDEILVALRERLQLSRACTNELLKDFQIIGEALTKQGVPHVVLKGFSLVPEFSPQFEFRHQADIDLWIEPARMPDALSALAPHGFVAKGSGPNGAITFVGPGDARVSMNESIYRPGRPRRLELHVTLVERSGAVVIDYPTGQWQRTIPRHLGDISYCSLSRPDMFVYQVFHAFRHVMDSWIRPSWIYEIAHFLILNECDEGFWQDVCRSIGDGSQLRDALGLVLDLTRRIFRCGIPGALSEVCLDRLPSRITLWNAHFGQQFVLTGPSRNKVSLFVQKGFVSDPAEWQSYARKSLFPITSNPALSEIRGRSLTQSFSDRWNKLAFLQSKVAYHLKSLATYPYHSLRWHLIQRANPRP